MFSEIDDIKRRMSDSESKIAMLQVELKANTEITTAIKEDTRDLLTFAQTLGGLTKFLAWLANFLWWLAPIAGAALSVWAYLHGKKEGG